jgi:hypothetical protein
MLVIGLLRCYGHAAVQEFFKQALLGTATKRPPANFRLSGSRREPLADHRTHFLLGDRVTRPTRHRGGEIYIVRFRVERRLSQPIEAIEKVIDEPLDSPVSVALLRPIVHRQERRDADSTDRLAYRNQVRIVVVAERRRKVIICEPFVVFDGDELTSSPG